MIDCFLSLGSNMGNKLINIQKAITLIESSSKNSFLSKSPIYESKALYNTQLDNFYNTVIKIKTSSENLFLQIINLTHILCLFLKK